MKLPTDFPKNYLIGYEDLDEMYNDYVTITNQMEFLKQYNGDVNYDVSISIGEFDYVLNVTIWKI